MTIIAEDYVSFETAKLLKEKGFIISCRAGYTSHGSLKDIEVKAYLTNATCPDTYWECTAPTLQMAMKWLREEKGIAAVPILSSVLDNERFLWDIEITVAKTNESYHQGWIYESYERACEAAIKYCIKNLI